MSKSLAETVALLPPDEYAKVFVGYEEADWEALKWDAGFWLRPEQKIPDGDWFITALISGRGFGKTFAMCQWVRRKALENPGCRIAIGGRTSGDVRRIMVDGESGILAIHHPDERPEYKQQKAALYWPNGSMAELHSSEAPDAARGVQYHYAAGDEFASWKTIVDSSGATLYSNLIAATRLGDNPQMVLGTTPKRTKAMKDLFERSKEPKQRIEIVTGTTRDNTSLSKTYIENLERQYGNSDLAKQEIEGQMLGDAEGLFFTDAMIEKSTITYGTAPYLPLRFIAVDPSVAEEPGDECGIIAMGVTGEREPHKRTAYVLEDYSLRGSPEVWIKAVVDAAREHKTRFIIVEGNQGRQLLQMAINTIAPELKVLLINASTGKHKRAEPVVILMQQGRVKIVDNLPTLTDQLIFFDPENTKDAVDDRMDAMVHGVVAGLVSPPDGLRVPRHTVTSASKHKIPNAMGTGRRRTPNTMRNRRK